MSIIESLSLSLPVSLAIRVVLLREYADVLWQDLKSDCSNPQLNVAYCVHGSAQVATCATPDNGGCPHGRSAATGTAASPRQTTDTVAGGVPTGWPGINSPRYRKIMGLGPKEEL